MRVSKWNCIYLNGVVAKNNDNSFCMPLTVFSHGMLQRHLAVKLTVTDISNEQVTNNEVVLRKSVEFA